MKSILIFLAGLLISQAACSSQNMYYSMSAYQNTALMDVPKNTAIEAAAADTYSVLDLDNLIMEELGRLSAKEAEWNMVIMDVNGKVVSSIGDIEKLYSPESTFRAFITAVLVDKYNLKLDSDVDNSNYIYEDGVTVPSWYMVSPKKDAFEMMKSFQDNFVNVNFSSIIREYDKLENKDAFIGDIKNMGFSMNNAHDAAGEKLSLFTIGKGVEISFLDMAKNLTVFANKGRTAENKQIISEDTSVVMNELLHDAANFTIDQSGKSSESNIIAGLFDTSSYPSSELGTGNIKTTFIGLAPYDKPQYVIVADANTLSSDINRAVTSEEMYGLVSNVFNFINNKKVNEKHLIRINDISELTNAENKLVYWGRPSCPDCIAFLPELFDVAVKKQIDIYYFDTDRWRSHPAFESVINKYNVKTVPYLINLNGENFEVVYDSLDNLDWKQIMEDY